MPDRSARLLERALLFSFVIHGVAMLATAVLLLPGLPGGGSEDPVRITYVAEHPWRWRLGWLPWQLTALSDLLIGIGLVRARFVPKVAALLTLLVTIAAIVADQAGQVAWMTRGIDLARAGDAAAYLAYESRIFGWTAYWGATLYTVAALGWTWCLVAGRTWSRLLTWLSAVLWPLFLYVSMAPLWPSALEPAPIVVGVGNAVGFVLLEVWLALAIEAILRRTRPDTEHGRWAPWRHPRRVVGRLLDVVANSRFARALAERLPVPAMLSDITDVIYVNYLVPASRLEPLVPAGLELQRVGAQGELAVFTFLTFRHGRFGPRVLGPLRRLLPSPVQTNWRIYVRDPRSGHAGIHFVTNAVSSAIHALGARMMSEGMPMHCFATAMLTAHDGRVAMSFDGAGGSAPDANAELSACAAPETGPWSAAFGSWSEMLAHVVPQDRALTTQPWHERVTRQEIRLDIPLEACEPLRGRVASRAASAIVGDAESFCFRVPSVRFRFEGEAYDRDDAIR